MSQFPKGVTILLQQKAPNGLNLRLDFPDGHDLVYNKDSNAISVLDETPIQTNTKPVVVRCFAVIARDSFVCAYDFIPEAPSQEGAQSATLPQT